MTTAEAYPLHWPPGWPRTEARKRDRARFSAMRNTEHGWRRGEPLTVAAALGRLRAELGRLDARYVVISTNVELRNDGLPYSGRAEPKDPGVAVYFRLKDSPYCLPCDRWDRVADNLAAVAAHIDAMRGMERWGVGSAAAHFAGFKALPPPGQTSVSTQGPAWWNVLGVQPNASTDVVRAAYRALATQHHPDRGGDAGAMAAINRAWEQAQGAVRS